MKKEKMKKMNAKKAKEDAIKRAEIYKRLDYAANHDIKTVLEHLGTALRGLTEEQVDEKYDEFGDNKVTKHKKESLLKRVGESFINPFTAILLVLAIVSCVTDIIIPIKQNTPEDVNIVTVVIILAMVIISGALRFVQEIRSGNAADRLLDMITTTASVERFEERKRRTTY